MNSWVEAQDGALINIETGARIVINTNEYAEYHSKEYEAAVIAYGPNARPSTYANAPTSTDGRAFLFQGSYIDASAFMAELSTELGAIKSAFFYPPAGAPPDTAGLPIYGNSHDKLF